MSALFWILIGLSWVCFIGSFAARSAGVAGVGFGFMIAAMVAWAFDAGVLQ